MDFTKLLTFLKGNHIWTRIYKPDELTAPLVKAIEASGEKTAKQLASIFEHVSEIKGEPGEKPTDKELLALIKPLIPDPIKGDKGDKLTAEEILAIVRPLIPKPIPGKPPTKDELLEIIKPLIPAPYIPIKGVDYFDGKDGKPGDKGKDFTPIDRTRLKKELVKELKSTVEVKPVTFSLYNREQKVSSLGDVDLTAPTNNQALVYSNGKWINGTVGGGSVGPGTINELAYFDSATSIASLAVATYPSLTELSYVKGVTSAVQTQLDGTALLAGRSGGQTLKGGTAVGDLLQLTGTSGIGTSTANGVQIMVGNNGATRAISVKNDGKVSIGSTGGYQSNKFLTVTDGASPTSSAGANGILVDISGGGGIYMTGGAVQGKYEAYSGALGVGTMSAHPLELYSNNSKRFEVTSAGVATFSVDVNVPDEAYGAGWNASLEVPTKNAVYDQMELKAPLISPSFTTPALGTPTSGTLTNCTGLPVTGIVDDTTSALGIGTLELGHATDTTLSRSAAGVLAVEGVVIPSISSTNTLTNKRVTKRVVTTTDDATAVIDTDSYDEYKLSAVANATTFTVTGTPTDGQTLIIKFKDAGVSKGLTFTGFTAIGVTIPTATTVSKWTYVGCKYNSTATTWHVIAVTTEA